MEERKTEEIVRFNEDKIDAIIELLLKKKIITEEELSKEIEDLYKD